jgi:hypothetical protein
MAALDFSPGRNTQRGAWVGDFRYENGRILVKSTGVWMRSDLQLWTDIFRWLTYYVFVRWHGLVARLTKPAGPRIWFTPHQPRPWYIIWAAMVWSGARFAKSPQHADAAFYFEDQTIAAPPVPVLARHFNFGVGDVSKTHVAHVCEEVFGYPFVVDPTTYEGPAVEKSEGNGLHDGRIVHCPAPALPGKTYQRLIRTADETGMARDLRTLCIGRKPVVVFDKRKPPGESFSIQNKSVAVRTPDEVFSPQDIAQIEAFCAAMRLDWGGIDVLREAETGRLFVVDVNKTDTGPAVILSWADRKKATTLMADALVAMARASPQYTQSFRASGARPGTQGS